MAAVLAVEGKPLKHSSSHVDVEAAAALAGASGGLSTCQPMQIEWRDIRYSVRVKQDKKAAAAAARGAAERGEAPLPVAKRGLCGGGASSITKDILKGLSGIINPGRLTAVMGASGAGKTTLLNVLAGNVKGKVTLAGDLLVNGEPVTSDTMQRISGFVHQEDVILDSMTVREALLFAAALRLPPSMSGAVKRERAMAVADMLNLTKALDSYVGSELLKGISGGEKRRLSLAMEMITNPSILFADEPTSGLDTYNAFKVAAILRSLAQTFGRTVVATIHQPSSEVFQQFDDLLVLAEGEVLFHGPAQALVPYFDRLGYTCPTYTNPADFLFMDVLHAEQKEEAAGTELDLVSFLNKSATGVSVEDAALDRRQKELTRLKGLTDSWRASPEAETTLAGMHDSSKRSGGVAASSIQAMASPFVQGSLLLMRALRHSIRNKFILQGKLMQTLALGLIIGLIYLNITDVYPAAFQDRQGSLFFLIVNVIFSSVIGTVTVFGDERAVFLREYNARLYNLGPYFWSRWVMQVPFFILIPILNACIVYWMIGYQAVASKFFIYCGVMILVEVVGGSLGLFAGCLFDNVEVAISILPLVILPLMVFSGFFVNSDDIPPYFSWIQYLSPMRYAFIALCLNEFTGLTVICPPGTQCPPDLSGETALQNLGFTDKGSIAQQCGVLLALGLGVLLIAYVALWLQVRRQRSK